MASRIQLRRDSAANWTSNNPVLSLGEVGIETDTLKLKIGNGSSAWSSLSYASEPIPSQDTHSGKYLTTNGTALSWGTVDLSSKADLASPTFTGTVNAADLVLSGDLTVNGTTTTVNSTTITIDDKNIELGSVATPTDTTADGGGITLKGTTDKTFNWVDATDAWTSSEHMNLATGKEFRINGTSVLSSSTLGSGVTGSSLTSVGVIASGTWEATDVALAHGGTNASLTAVNGGVVYSTSTAMAITSAGTAGQVLTSSGAGAPTWQTPSAGGFDAFLLSGM